MMGEQEEDGDEGQVARPSPNHSHLLGDAFLMVLKGTCFHPLAPPTQLGSQGLRFPTSHLPALRQLQSTERLPVARLQLQLDSDKLNLAMALWSEGLLHVC